MVHNQLNGLNGKNILLGVTGSIAAYKSAELVRRLRDAGAHVRVCMTEHAKQFITALTMQAVSGHPVHDDLFDLNAEAAMGHIALARWADLILIAPATADMIACLATGRANDLLTTLCLASKAAMVIAPAMNQLMWAHVATQDNIALLEKRGVQILGPASGQQACGDTGWGRMLEPVDIVDMISKKNTAGELSGLRVLLTAGPTHEALDPVRYLSNGSTGKMGYALAVAARQAGAQVTLISGPTALAQPAEVDYLAVRSAQSMYEVVMQRITQCDIFLSVAAVSDYRPEVISEQKIHKNALTMSLTLVRNPDIAKEVGALSQKPFLVGFAAETDEVIASAKRKRLQKNMDMIIANHVSQGMGTDDNQVTVISEIGETVLPKMGKDKLAQQLISLIAHQYQITKNRNKE